MPLLGGVSFVVEPVGGKQTVPDIFVFPNQEVLLLCSVQLSWIPSARYVGGQVRYGILHALRGISLRTAKIPGLSIYEGLVRDSTFIHRKGAILLAAWLRRVDVSGINPARRNE